MKITILFTIISILYTFTPTKQLAGKTNQEERIFKTTIEAEYSAKRSGVLSRNDAFKRGLITTNIYNSDGELVSYEKNEIDGEYFEKTVLEKETDGTLNKSIRYNKAGETLGYTLTKVGSKGEINEYKSYNVEDELTTTQKNEYDSKGNVTGMTVTNILSNRTFKTVSKYNELDQLLEKTRLNADETIKDVRTYAYDENSNEILEEMNRPNGDYTKFVSTFDDHNNILTQYWYDKEGNQKHWNNWEYTYDENNNWITKKRFSKGELGYVWERKIEYH